MQAFLGEAARRRQSRRSSTPSKGTSGPSAISATTSSHQRTKSSSSGRLFHSSSRPSKRNSVVKQPSNKSLASEQASPPDSSHDDSTGEKKNFDVFAFMEHDDEAGSTAIEEEVDGNDESTQLQRPLAPPAAGSHIPHDAPEHHSPVGYSDLEVHATAQDKDYEHHDGQLDWVAEPARSDTFHSDSGISVHSSSNSSGNDSPLLSQKLRSRPDTANSVTSVPKLYLGADTFPFRDHHSRRASAARLRRLPAATSQNQELYGKCPESYYGPSSNNTIPGIETQSVHSFSSAKVQDLPQVSSDCSSPPHQQHIFDSVEMPSPPPSQSKPTSSSSAKTSPSYASFPTTNRKSSSGYSLLASSISTWNPSSDAVLRPIYRKFETLNNRILLYLQDEICEMEQDLQELDEAIATEEERMLKGGLPSHPGVGLGKASRKRRRESRRQECKFPSQLQWARQELMGRLMGKVSQYSMSFPLCFALFLWDLRMLTGEPRFRSRSILLLHPNPIPAPSFYRGHYILPKMDLYTCTYCRPRKRFHSS